MCITSHVVNPDISWAIEGLSCYIRLMRVRNLVGSYRTATAQHSQKGMNFFFTLFTQLALACLSEVLFTTPGFTCVDHIP